MSPRKSSKKATSYTAAQIELLSAIDSTGSISAAARTVGISYKTAWDRIDTMNYLSERTLVTRSAGGARGGGTSLTDYGTKILQGLKKLQQDHEMLTASLGSELGNVDDVAQFLRGQVNTSARNQYYGNVKRIKRGEVNSELTLNISANTELVAVITNDSLNSLALKKGSNAIALIKASWIMLSTSRKLASSARNQLRGKVSKINRGPVNCEVILDLGEDKSLCAVITRESVSRLGLKKGVVATALFKASSVILMAA